MSNFMGVGTFWIGLNWADLGCWRLTLRYNNGVSARDAERLPIKFENFYSMQQFLIALPESIF